MKFKANNLERMVDASLRPDFLKLEAYAPLILEAMLAGMGALFTAAAKPGDALRSRIRGLSVSGKPNSFMSA